MKPRCCPLCGEKLRGDELACLLEFACEFRRAQAEGLRMAALLANDRRTRTTTNAG